MKTKEFFDYLFYIGVVTDKTMSLFSSLVEIKTKDIKNQKIDKSTFLKSLMVDYFISLDREQLSIIGETVINRYNNNRLITISKYLSKLFHKKESSNYKYINKYFYQWKDFNKKTPYCKPRPPLLKKSQSYIKLKKNQKKVNSKNNYLNNIGSPNSNNNMNNFFLRLNNYNNRKEDAVKKNRMISDEDTSINCTFIPNLALTQKKNVSVRKKIKSGINRQHDVASTIEKKETKPRKKVDQNKINKLYNDFHRRDKNKEILKKNIDMEKGITFSPKLNSESKYNKNVKDSLYDRNQKLLEEKKQFINEFNYLRDLQMKGINIVPESNEK